jgi:CheY-like chemotaxis protein
MKSSGSKMTCVFPQKRIADTQHSMSPHRLSRWLAAGLDANPQIRNIPARALTASVMDDEHERYLAMGITAVLSKPLSIDELNRAIGNALQAQQPLH